MFAVTYQIITWQSIVGQFKVSLARPPSPVIGSLLMIYGRF